MIAGVIFAVLAILFLVAVPVGLRSTLRRVFRKRISRRDRRAAEVTAGTRCPCGYDLLATDAARCPECGRVIHFSKTPDELGLTPAELRMLSEAKQRTQCGVGTIGRVTVNSISATSAIAICGVARRFADGTDAICSLSIDVAAGEFLALIGPSGCGKSTLLRMIAGLDRPTAGAIDVDRARVAYVFQDANLLPWRNVLRNVTLPLELSREGSRRERVELAQQALHRVGLDGVERKYPAELSGGMRMRASLARALVTRPTLLLLDEPFAALDEISRGALDAMLRDLWFDARPTVVFVTHSIAEATFLAERAIVFSPRPASIVADERIDLPRERDDALRTSTAFATIQRRLFDALHRAEAIR